MNNPLTGNHVAKQQFQRCHYPYLSGTITITRYHIAASNKRDSSDRFTNHLKGIRLSYRIYQTAHLAPSLDTDRLTQWTHIRGTENLPLQGLLPREQAGMVATRGTERVSAWKMPVLIPSIVADLQVGQCSVFRGTFFFVPCLTYRCDTCECRAGCRCHTYVCCILPRLLRMLLPSSKID